jgi:riboflavin synthase
MFTGIITDIGEIANIELRGDMRARIKTQYPSSSIAMGASIACDGVCLTVVDKGPLEDAFWFDVDISAETLSKTLIGSDVGGWVIGRSVNLERALKVGDELGGHIVSGHVDGVASILSMADSGDSTRLVFAVPQELAKFIAPKGSVALNGTSFTVNGVDGNEFDINIIPHTKSATTWGNAKIGDIVNLEIDTLARYVARLNDMQAH